MELDELLTIVDRMRTSKDASDRVKAAAEIAKYGTPEIAPAIIETIWEEEKSNVREIALHALVDVLKEDAREEIEKIVDKHFDNHVKFYAISRINELEGDWRPILKKAIKDEDSRVLAIATKQILDKQYSNFAEDFIQLLNKDVPNSVYRNVLLALALWKYKAAEGAVRSLLKTSNSKEIITLCNFCLARFGDKNSKKFLKTEEIDTEIRFKYNGEMYRGREGLLKLI